MTILYVGSDLAKNVFALHGVAAGGAVVLRQPGSHGPSCTNLLRLIG